MRYLVATLAALVYTAGVWLAINTFIQTRLETPCEEKKIRLWIPPTTRRWVYFAGCFLCVLAVGLVPCYFYEEGTMVTILKLQCLTALLTCFSYTDLKIHIIPNRFVVIGACMRLPFLLAEFLLLREDFLEIVKQLGLGILIIGAFFVVCAIVSKTGFGMGDVKLFILVAAYQGLTGALSSIFLAFVCSFLAAIVLIVLKKKTKKDVIPMAPFVLAGTVACVLLTKIG